MGKIIFLDIDGVLNSNFWNDAHQRKISDEDSIRGVLLIGHMEVCTDHGSRALLWKDRDIMYYPQGVDDPDYCVYRFVAERGNYYHGLQNIDFDILELE